MNELVIRVGSFKKNGFVRFYIYDCNTGYYWNGKEFVADKNKKLLFANFIDANEEINRITEENLFDKKQRVFVLPVIFHVYEFNGNKEELINWFIKQLSFTLTSCRNIKGPGNSLISFYMNLNGLEEKKETEE